jgi:hypothetical protein
LSGDRTIKNRLQKYERQNTFTPTKAEQMLIVLQPSSSFANFRTATRQPSSRSGHTQGAPDSSWRHHRRVMCGSRKSTVGDFARKFTTEGKVRFTAAYPCSVRDSCIGPLVMIETSAAISQYVAVAVARRVPDFRSFMAHPLIAVSRRRVVASITMAKAKNGDKSDSLWHPQPLEEFLDESSSSPLPDVEPVKPMVNMGESASLLMVSVPRTVPAVVGV